MMMRRSRRKMVFNNNNLIIWDLFCVKRLKEVSLVKHKIQGGSKK